MTYPRFNYPSHPLDSAVSRELHDLAAASRRGDLAKVEDCLDAIARASDAYGEAILRGRGSVHAHRPVSRKQRLAKAA